MNRIEVYFVHPSNSQWAIVELNSQLTSDQAIQALIDENFIISLDKTASCYRLGCQPGDIEPIGGPDIFSSQNPR